MLVRREKTQKADMAAWAAVRRAPICVHHSPPRRGAARRRPPPAARLPHDSCAFPRREPASGPAAAPAARGPAPPWGASGPRTRIVRSSSSASLSTPSAQGACRRRPPRALSGGGAEPLGGWGIFEWAYEDVGRTGREGTGGQGGRGKRDLDVKALERGRRDPRAGEGAAARLRRSDQRSKSTPKQPTKQVHAKATNEASPRQLITGITGLRVSQSRGAGAGAARRGAARRGAARRSSRGYKQRPAAGAGERQRLQGSGRHTSTLPRGGC